MTPWWSWGGSLFLTPVTAISSYRSWAKAADESELPEGRHTSHRSNKSLIVLVTVKNELTDMSIIVKDKSMDSEAFV